MFDLKIEEKHTCSSLRTASYLNIFLLILEAMKSSFVAKEGKVNFENCVRDSPVFIRSSDSVNFASVRMVFATRMEESAVMSVRSPEEKSSSLGMPRSRQPDRNLARLTLSLSLGRIKGLRPMAFSVLSSESEISRADADPKQPTGKERIHLWGLRIEQESCRSQLVSHIAWSIYSSPLGEREGESRLDRRVSPLQDHCGGGDAVPCKSIGMILLSLEESDHYQSSETHPSGTSQQDDQLQKNRRPHCVHGVRRIFSRIDEIEEIWCRRYL